METISQRQLRNDSGEILRRAAAGEEFRVRAGEATVDVRRSRRGAVDRLAAAGLLSAGSGDDFGDFPPPVDAVEPLDETLDALRGSR